MKTKTLLKSRRGISPILATLLLIVIAVAAIVVTYAWIMIYMRSAGQQAGTRIKFDSLSINATSNEVTIYVRNWGTEPAVVDRVYIEGTDVTEHVTPTLPQTIPVDQVLSLKVNGTAAGIDFIEGSWYKVKVAGPAASYEESAKAR
ncbi:MAG: archaellin/type IV pilin N-terminal domain-containing protein [Candidatus Bathyarchaeia archaeon]